jgi:hypothetical protein
MEGRYLLPGMEGCYNVITPELIKPSVVDQPVVKKATHMDLRDGFSYCYLYLACLTLCFSAHLLRPFVGDTVQHVYFMVFVWIGCVWLLSFSK